MYLLKDSLLGFTPEFSNHFNPSGVKHHIPKEAWDHVAAVAQTTPDHWHKLLWEEFPAMIIVADNFFANITRYFDPMEWDIHFTSSNPSLGNICGGSPAAVGCAYGCVQYTGIGVDALTGTTVPSLALILATDILHILSFHCSIEPDFF